MARVPTAPIPASVPDAQADHVGALRAINVGVWLVASVVMAVSATTASKLLAEHGMHWAQGLALGVAVDAGIVVALVGDQMLHRVAGRRSRWGTALRWVTAGMSLLLNCAGAWQAGDRLGVALHALPPVLLIVLAEAAQAYRMALTRSTGSPGVSSDSLPGTGLAEPGRPDRPQYRAGEPVSTAVAGIGDGGDGRTGTGSPVLGGTEREVVSPGTERVDTAAGTGLTLIRSTSRSAEAPAVPVVSKPAVSKPAGSTPVVSTVVSKPGVSKPAVSTAVSTPAEVEFDPELWQRAVELAARHHQDTGREIRLDDVQNGLNIGRNRAAVLRRKVLAHLEHREVSA